MPAPKAGFVALVQGFLLWE